MNFDDPLFFLNASGYGVYNREIAYKIGSAPAIILAELVAMKKHFKDELISNQHGTDLFYATIDYLHERTGLTRREQDTALEKLKSLGFLNVKVFGIPPRRYFSLNTDKILEFFNLKKINTICTKRQIDLPKEPKKTSKKDYNLAEMTNCPGGNDKSVSIYTYEPEEELKEIHAPPNGVASASNCKHSFKEKSPEKKGILRPKPNVSIAQDEHDKLVEKFGVDLVKEGYEDLSEWKDSADPKTVAKHKSDYRRLRKWVIPNLIEDKQKAERVAQQKIAPHRRGSKLVTPGDYECEPKKFKEF
jgi:hypothetical protein